MTDQPAPPSAPRSAPGGGHPTWLLTGGAGYIGSHVLRAMTAAGLAVVVLDDLSTGHADRVPADVPLVVGSVLDGALVSQVLRDHAVSGVVHLAAKKSVPESVADPLRYYRENVLGALTLLESMAAQGVRRLVFSSSAAVYGNPESDSVDEAAPTRPESPYGRTKLISEWMIRDACAALGLSSISLRYFNVVGCAEPALVDTGGTNLFPLVIRALTSAQRPVVFGDDYPTRDGSCVRDYIHVQDLAEAHVAAAEVLMASQHVDEVVNIGCGVGHTVFEVLDAMAEVSGLDATPTVLPRRPGDPAGMVATASFAEQLLGWRSTKDLTDMVGSAWHGTQAAAEMTAGAGGTEGRRL
jgi:UDP-glucose 4-epimerase